METKRAAVYVRVSTAEQDTGLQETELREYVERRGWSYVVYRDKAQSGAKNDRPALTAMLNDLRKRKADVVVVWALDRLARSLKQLLTIAEECRLLGVDLVSLRQNIDSTLPAGRLTFQVLSEAQLPPDGQGSRGQAARLCSSATRTMFRGIRTRLLRPDLHSSASTRTQLSPTQNGSDIRSNCSP